MPVRLNLPKPSPLREPTQGRRVRIRGFRSTSRRAGLVTGTRSAYGVDHRPEALSLATATGVLFGVSDVAIKYPSHAPGPLLGLISPRTLVAVISSVISFSASARSLQLGLAVEVIAVTSVAANLAAILGGVLVFGEPVGSGPLGISARVLAFCLVIAGAAFMPAPVRAIGDQHAQAIADG
jgi:hypothetical protein